MEREEGGWDADVNWEDILSLGEQQRLGMVSHIYRKVTHLNKSTKKLVMDFFIIWRDAFCSAQARLFFHKPKFGILDECTKYVMEPWIFDSYKECLPVNWSLRFMFTFS